MLNKINILKISIWFEPLKQRHTCSITTKKKKDYFSIKMNSHRSPGVRNASQDLTTEHVNMSTERN